MVETIGPDRSLEDARAAGRFFREHGAQSRPIHLHGIDLVTSSPHVFTDRIESEAADDVLQPGMVLVVEPTPITADGSLGMFFGHTFAVTETGRECLDTFPWQLTVV
jgi:Xaa-Pro aminopeptidase